MELANSTNDPHRRSWVESANASSEFPLQNLPFAVFKPRASVTAFRGGVAIGDQIVDLAALAASGLLHGDAAIAVKAAAQPVLNELMELGVRYWQALRGSLFEALALESTLRRRLETCLTPQSEVEYAVPARIGDYTDFYTSIHHATAVGRLFRPDGPLLPNYKWMPVGYHGRSSSIRVSGAPISRPQGQRITSGRPEPLVGPSLRMDYEVEIGIFVGTGNTLGSAISIDDAESHVFGMCLLNDWSARDLQGWEAQPLGPFLAKNFATSISPWIIPLQALAPFRLPFLRTEDEPQPLPYLDSVSNRQCGAFDIRLEAFLQSEKMQARGDPPQRLSSTSYRHAYWTVAQLVAHHTVNGCNLCAGDLLGTGTQSGPSAAEAGSLLELSQGGTRSLALGSDEHRMFLEDGDTVMLKGWCEKPGAVRIGFGNATARIGSATSAV